jgi:hypothetical protein
MLKGRLCARSCHYPATGKVASKTAVTATLVTRADVDTHLVNALLVADTLQNRALLAIRAPILGPILADGRTPLPLTPIIQKITTSGIE